MVIRPDKTRRAVIFSAFFSLILLVISGFMSPLLLISDVTTDSTVVQSVATAATYIAPIGGFFPLVAFFWVITTITGFEAAYGAFKVIKWAYKKIPTIS